MAIIACYYNPCGWDRPKQNYSLFRRAMEHFGHVHMVEAVFPGQYPITDGLQIQCDNRHIMWQKERMIQLAIERLPARYDAVAWIDADLLFLSPSWYEETLKALESTPVVHLFERIHYVGKSGRVERINKSIGYRVKHAPKDLKTWYSPGGAWAARREVAEQCIDPLNVIGGGDAATTFAWLGETRRYARWVEYNANWHAHYQAWADEQYQQVKGQIGCLNQDIVHLYHGDRDNRQYTSRIEIFRKHEFDPLIDVRVGENGLMEWASDKREMHNAVRKYFWRRNEDGRR